MQYTLQSVVVAVIVLASVAFAGWHLAPARTKLRLLDALKPDTRTLIGRWLARRRASAAEQLLHGCGSCSHAKPRAKHAGPR